MATTTDRDDPRLTRGGDTEETEQAEVYLVLSDEEIAKGFQRPLRVTYIHNECKTSTTMARKIAETYAVNPWYYGFTYCVHCKKHLPVSEFRWEDGSRVGE